MPLIYLLLATSGLGLSGYLGLFEILIECGVILWLSVVVWRKQLGPVRRWSIPWIRGFKRRLVRRAIDKGDLSAVAAVVGSGMVVGWIVTLGWVFFRPVGFVVAREVKETVLDGLIFLPLLLIVGRTLRGFEQVVEEVEDEAWEADVEAETPDPRDPAYWDFMERWAAGQRAIEATMWAGFVYWLVGVVGRAGFYALLVCWIAISYGAGSWIQGTFPNAALDAVREWQLDLFGW